MTIAQPSPKEPFPLLKWCGVTVFGWMAGWPISWFLTGGEGLLTIKFLSISFLVIGTLIGLGQQLVLRRLYQGVRFWFLATLFGVALAMGLATVGIIVMDSILLQIPFLLLGVFTPGLTQWFVLPSNFDIDFKTAILLILGWIGAFGMLALTAFILFFLVMSENYEFEIAVIVIGNLICGTILGGLSGLGVRNAAKV